MIFPVFLDFFSNSMIFQGLEKVFSIFQVSMIFPEAGNPDPFCQFYFFFYYLPIYLFYDICHAEFSKKLVCLRLEILFHSGPGNITEL